MFAGTVLVEALKYILFARLLGTDYSTTQPTFMHSDLWVCGHKSIGCWFCLFCRSLAITAGFLPQVAEARARRVDSALKDNGGTTRWRHIARSWCCRMRQLHVTYYSNSIYTSVVVIHYMAQCCWAPLPKKVWYPDTPAGCGLGGGVVVVVVVVVVEVEVAVAVEVVAVILVVVEVAVVGSSISRK